MKQLPVLPNVASEALQMLENPRASAGLLGSIVEQDQSLTARVLHVANSPFYGFPRQISTIDLAIVVLGFDAIREIILSLVVQGILARTRAGGLAVDEFWKYSVFSGSTARYLARKLGYRVAGEAFVAGLMHDIGVLIIAQYLPRELQAIRQLQSGRGISLVRAEQEVLQASHADIGAWLGEQWNLPQKLIHAIQWHHDPPPPGRIAPAESGPEDDKGDGLDNMRHPLTALVALTEWFAQHLGFKKWAREARPSPLNIPPELMARLGAHDVLEPESAIEAVKPALLEEFAKSSAFGDY